MRHQEPIWEPLKHQEIGTWSTRACFSFLVCLQLYFSGFWLMYQPIRYLGVIRPNPGSKKRFLDFRSFFWNIFFQIFSWFVAPGNDQDDLDLGATMAFEDPLQEAPGNDLGATQASKDLIFGNFEKNMFCAWEKFELLIRASRSRKWKWWPWCYKSLCFCLWIFFASACPLGSVRSEKC